MFTAVFLIIAKRQKLPKCPSTDTWINECGIYPYMGCYSVIKNEIPIWATTWVKLSNILLSERSPSQKTKLYDSIYIKCPKQANLYIKKVD